jgi:hypothetical protein
MGAKMKIAKEIGKAALAGPVNYAVGKAKGAALGVAKKNFKRGVKTAVGVAKHVSSGGMQPKSPSYATKKLLSESRALSYGQLAATKTRR